MALHQKFTANYCGGRGSRSNRRNFMKHQHAKLKQKAKEKLKDLHIPVRPKKPLSSFFRFLQDFRVDFLKRNPQSRVTEIVKHGAQDWARAHSSLKERYTQEYRHDMQDYNKKILKYSSKLTPLQKETIKAFQKEKQEHKKKRDFKKKLRASDRPKRPIGPYMQFLLEKSKQSNKKMVELMHDMKVPWRSMTDHQKHRYVALYEADRRRYDVEMAEWEQRMIAEGNTDIVRNAGHTRKPTRVSKVGKHKRKR